MKRRRTRPYRFQVEGYRQLERWHGRGIIGDELGLGKTLTAWLYVKKCRPRGPIVIVVPAHLRLHWRRQAKLHLGIKKVHVLTGMAADRRPPKRRVKDIYVISYNLLGNPRKSTGTWMSWMRRLRPRVVIGDEGHYIVNPESQRSKGFRELCRMAEQVIILTGTAVVNNPGDLWPLLNCVRPDKYDSFYTFREKYCVVEWTPWGPKVVGAKNLDKLHRRLKATCLIRRLKREVFKDLPPIIRSVVPLELSPDAAAEYKEAKETFIRWLSKQSRHKALRARNNERLIQLGYLKRLAGIGKLDKVFEWMDDFLAESDEKLVVFAVHKKVIQALRRRYRGKCVVITGETPVKERDGIVSRFLSKDKYRLLFGNIKAAGTGWSAKGVSNVATIEFGWNAADHAQAEGRCHGIGRGKKGLPTNSYYLVAQNTIEEVLCQLIENKQSYSDQILDGGVNDSGINVFEELERALSKRK